MRFTALARPMTAHPAEITLKLEVARAIYTIVRTEQQHFPENIFWDKQYLVRYLLDQAQGQGMGYIREFAHTFTELLALFGRGSAISFRYVHDFMYGFDWAKWVKKDREQRSHIAPFSLEFMHGMMQRGQELLQLIEENDQKYHQLGSGEKYRNPFAFSREPADETRLLRGLAAQGMIPVPAWDWNATPRWDLAFADARQALSSQLGILKAKPATS